MRENTLKQRLDARKAAFGVMCTFPSPPVVEMLGYLGFDWILLDNEHGSLTVDTAEGCIAAAVIHVPAFIRLAYSWEPPERNHEGSQLIA